VTIFDSPASIVKRSRDQSGEVPRRRIWRVMVLPEILLPLPDFFEELLATQVVARDALAVELAFHHDLRRDAGVVGARLPQRVVAAHAVVARQRIHDRLVEAVAHVQRAGDIRRRQQDAEIVGFGGVEPGGEIAARLPDRVPAPLDFGGFEALGEFHKSCEGLKGVILTEPAPPRPLQICGHRGFGLSLPPLEVGLRFKPLPMIRKFLRHVFRRGESPSTHGPAMIPVARHGIRRDHVSLGARRTCETLQQAGHKAYIVGGAVRDLIAGIDPKDYDIATDATPEQVRSLFRRARIIGRRFQIVHVMQGGETLEVSTFRAAHDAHTVKDEHGRVLRDNVFGSIAEDAARRDFTVNALYYEPSSETVIDYHHGVADLQQKTLRMIGDPRQRYREDPVRMLRAVRLSAKLGLALDPAVRAPIREMAELIENVPAARLFDEMLKLLFSGHAVEAVHRLRDDGLHHGLLPLLDVILEQPLGEKFVMLALEGTDARVKAGKSLSPGYLFATLLWHEVLAAWDARKARGEVPIPALYEAMDEVLNVQGEKLAITRRIAGDIKDIWALQPRFEKARRQVALSPDRTAALSAPAMISSCCARKAARSGWTSPSGGTTSRTRIMKSARPC
jgi:poly(A) polymerase